VANNYALGSPTSQQANAGLTLNTNAGNTVNAFFTSSNPTIALLNDASTAGTGNVVLGNATAGTSTTLNIGAGGPSGNQGASNFDGSISDRSATNAGAVGNLNVFGGGFLALSGSNSFTGTTTITGSNASFQSEIQLQNALALENSTLNYNNQGGLLDFGNLTVASFGGLEGSQTLALNNDSAGAVTLTLGDNNVSSTSTGDLDGVGGIIKLGTGTITIGSGTSGGATYTGTTLVQRGTLVLGGTTDLTNTVDVSASAGAAGLTVQDHAMLDLTTTLEFSTDDGTAGGGQINGNPGASTVLITGSAVIIAPEFEMGAASRVPTGDSVTIAQNANVTINGPFNLLNTEGSTASVTTYNFNGGTLTANQFNLFQGSNPAGQLVTVNFNGTVITAGASDPSSSSFFLGALSGLTADVQPDGAIFNTNGFNDTVSALLLSGTSTDGGVTKEGVGTLTLTNANAYVGPTTIDAGILNIDGINALGGANYSGLVFNGGTLQYAATTGTNGSDDITSNAGGTAKPVTLTSSGTIDTNGNNVTYAHTFGNGGAGGFTETGLGSITLNAAATYTGATLINEGTLVLGSGGSLGNTATTVNSGATLQALAGNGGVGGSLTMAANSTLMLSDTTSFGTFNVGGNLSLTGTSTAPTTIDFNLGTGGIDNIAVAGGVLTGDNGAGKIVIAAAQTIPGLTNDTSYTLLTATSGLGTSLFSLGTTSLFINNETWLLTLANSTSTDEEVTLSQGTSNYYWKGGSGSSWSTLGNFYTDHTGSVQQTSNLSASSNVFLTTDSASNFNQTLDGNYEINSLSFTGTNTGTSTSAATNSITLAGGGPTSSLKIDAGGTFGDTEGNTYAMGTGLVVQAGSAAHTISANIGLGASQTWEIDNSPANALTVSGTISDASGSDQLSKTGTGTLILTASNTYSGGTIVRAGTLKSGATNTLNPNGTLRVTGTGTFDLAGYNQTVSGLTGTSTLGVITASTGTSNFTINNGTASSFAGTISGGIALNLTGSNNVTLTGTNTYTGATTITSGTLTAASNAALGNATTGGLNMNPVTSGTATTFFTSLNPSIGFLQSVANAISNIVLGNTGGSGAATTLNVGGGGQTTIFNGDISDGSATLSTAVGNFDLVGGSLTLNGTDTYTGTTVVTSGTLTLGNSAAIQNSTLNYNNQGGTLSFGALTTANVGNLEGAQSLPLLNASAAPVTLVVGSATTNLQTATYSGVLSGGGSLTISGTGSTALTLSAPQTYTGTTTVTAGTLSITSGLGSSGLPTGAITVAIPAVAGTPAGTLNLTNATVYAASMNIANSNGGVGNTGTINISGNSSINIAGTVAINSTNGVFGGVLNLTGGTLSANAVTVSRDGLNYGTTAPTAGSTTDGIYVNGGTLIDSTVLDVGTANTNSSANMRMDSGAITVGGLTTIQDTNARFSDLDINGGTFTGTGGIQVGGGFGTSYVELLIRNGVVNTSGITVGDNTTQTIGVDQVQVNGGTTYLGSGGIVLGTAGSTNAVAIGNGSVTTTPIIAASAPWSSSAAMTLANNVSGGRPTFQTQDSLGNAQNIVLSGTLNGSGGLTKTGSGVLTLSGADSYAGTTHDNAGTLIVSGAIAGTSAAFVSSGATMEVDGSVNSSALTTLNGGKLDGTGSVGGITTTASDGSTLAPGLSSAGTPAAGVLTANGAVTLDSSAIFSIRLGVATAGDNDQLSVPGANTVTLNGATLQLNIGSFASQTDGMLYVLINGDSTGNGQITGQFAQSGSVVGSNGYVYDIFYNVNAGNTGVGNDVDLELIAAVPEPGTWAMLIAGIGMLIVWRRSRRNA
jgi:autotransporter-associated beta strand protein